MVILALALLAQHFEDAAPKSREDLYYRIETVAIPQDVMLEVGGLLARRDGTVMACTRRGEVFVIENAYGQGEPKFTRYAQGLHEPLGLLEKDDSIYVIQRSELSRMIDSNGDDRMDELETVCDAWQVGGNYHEYNFGPTLDRDGNFWITTNRAFGEDPFGDPPWRGFALKITPAGEMQPMCCGLRSPCGIGTSPEGELFYTDNQGEWVGTGKLCHLVPGRFYGHPFGIGACKDPLWKFAVPDEPPNEVLMPEAAKRLPTLELPAVWFPYDVMGRSAAGFVWDQTRGLFGPFAGQMFVADQYQSSVIRVFLEKVGERWQGACFPFRLGFQCGIVRVAWGIDGSLFCGETDRGWGSLGGKTMGLQRLVWTGATPFEIREMRATRDGFELVFTKEVDAASAGEASAYSLEGFTYLLHETYGSDEVDKAPCPVRAAVVSSDGLRVALTVEGVREGYVHELHAQVKSARGEPLLHDAAYYTLNARP